jgi:hypothetical protein
MRTCSQPSSRKIGHSRSRKTVAPSRRPSDVFGAARFAAKPTA